MISCNFPSRMLIQDRTTIGDTKTEEEERMRIARDIITCMAKPLACSPARSLTHPLTLSLSPDEMGRLDGPLVSCPLLLDPLSLSRPLASSAVDLLDAMPASGAATETLNTLEPNRQVIRGSRSKRAAGWHAPPRPSSVSATS